MLKTADFCQFFDCTEQDLLIKLLPITEKLDQTNKLAISFSGGETSAFMTALFLALFKDRYEVSVIFANTGQENEETLEFVRDCDTLLGFNSVWIEAVTLPHDDGVSFKVVDYLTADRTGEPFEAMIAKYGIPNPSFKHCSRVLKKQAIRAFYRPAGWKKYYTAIGIRADEWDRQSVKAEKERIIYPLIPLNVTKPDVNLFWSQQSFRLNLKGYQGNCKWCWKKSFRKLMTIAVENPEAFDFPRRMEEKYSNYRPASQPNRPLPARFFRGNRTVDDIFEMAKQDFVMADDDSLDTTVFTQGNLFDIDIGLSSGCEESCEAF